MILDQAACSSEAENFYADIKSKLALVTKCSQES
jgi:hypothetical protein